MEASVQRVRHHFRRPLASSRNILMTTAGNTVGQTERNRRCTGIEGLGQTGPVWSVEESVELAREYVSGMGDRWAHLSTVTRVASAHIDIDIDRVSYLSPTLL